jgi:hypothetical protein
MTEVFMGQIISQVKISENAVILGGESMGVEVRNTYTWGAEAGEVNE